MTQHDRSAGQPARPRLDPRKLLATAAAASPAPDGPPGGWRPPSIEAVQERFPELQVQDLIGRGGMGAVYRAVQSRLQRTVALKVLPPELASDPAFEERFLREARALAGLQHPRILTIHDFGERSGLFYLVTEFVEGMSLRELMKMGELSPSEALRIAPQICEALQFAHDHGVVHRDIKPENLLVNTAGNVKIADFGLARIVGEAPSPLTRSTQILGTPHYMAPEQWRHGVEVDHRADIYSVGVVLYEMLTGQLPLGHFDPPSRRQGVPPGLDAVVKRSLAQQPEQRYQRASDVGEDVEREWAAAPTASLESKSAPRSYDGKALVQAQLIAAWILAIGLLVRTLPGDRPLSIMVLLHLAPSTIVLMLCGFWAVRRIRMRRQGTAGLGLAIFTTWVIPTVIASCFPATALMRQFPERQLALVGSVIAGVLVGVLGIWWMIVFHRRVAADLA